jgi:hypothetical protein
MKQVTLTEDMRPWRKGDRVPLPNTVADELVEKGLAINPEHFVSNDDTAPVSPVRRVVASVKRIVHVGQRAKTRIK